MFSFLKSFAGVKGEQIGRDIVQAIVEMDPESATQAQLVEMEKDLDRAGEVIQKIRKDYDRELREWEEISKRYNQNMAAAEILQNKLSHPLTSEAEKLGIEASLGKLVVQLEQLAPEVEQERQDVDDAKLLLNEAEGAYREKAESLSKAKQALDRAKRDMQRAVIEQERAGEKAQRAAEVAGLRQNSTSKLNIAVDAMQRRADDARAKAATLKMKTDALHKAGGSVENDANIAEALRTVQGSPTPSGSLADRLARLKK
ncbi:PspA/IM30 family protein [Azospirillaceae bacterium]